MKNDKLNSTIKFSLITYRLSLWFKTLSARLQFNPRAVGASLRVREMKMRREAGRVPLFPGLGCKIRARAFEELRPGLLYLGDGTRGEGRGARAWNFLPLISARFFDVWRALGVMAGTNQDLPPSTPDRVNASNPLAKAGGIGDSREGPALIFNLERRAPVTCRHNRPRSATVAGRLACAVDGFRLRSRGFYGRMKAEGRRLNTCLDRKRINPWTWYCGASIMAVVMWVCFWGGVWAVMALDILSVK